MADGSNDDNNGGNQTPPTPELGPETAPPKLTEPKLENPTPEATDTSALNSQIVQAVDATNNVMSSMIGAEGNGIAYQKVAQAAAFSVQDATDFYRNIMAMSGAAQGVCLEQMIAAVAAQEYDKIPQYEGIIAVAQGTVAFAQTNFTNTGTAAGDVVNSFPKD